MSGDSIASIDEDSRRGRMVLHAAMGGLVISLGLTQFIPALRRRHPELNRHTGAVVASFMDLSTCGAMAYLSAASKDGIYSGPTVIAGRR
jgi:hypothetical protein